MTDTVNLARRGALKALSMATAMVAGPGKALAEAAVTAASASMPVAAPMVGGTLNRLRSGESTPLVYALNCLSEMQWASRGSRRVNSDGISYGIACFRSASPAVKVLWDEKLRQEKEEQTRVYDAARELLLEGKISL